MTPEEGARAFKLLAHLYQVDREGCRCVLDWDCPIHEHTNGIRELLHELLPGLRDYLKSQEM